MGDRPCAGDMVSIPFVRTFGPMEARLILKGYETLGDSWTVRLDESQLSLTNNETSRSYQIPYSYKNLILETQMIQTNAPRLQGNLDQVDVDYILQNRLLRRKIPSLYFEQRKSHLKPRHHLFCLDDSSEIFSGPAPQYLERHQIIYQENKYYIVTDAVSDLERMIYLFYDLRLPRSGAWYEVRPFIKNHLLCQSRIFPYLLK